MDHNYETVCIVLNNPLNSSAVTKQIYFNKFNPYFLLQLKTKIAHIITLKTTFPEQI